MNMDDGIRERLIAVSQQQMATIADACNRYPNIEMDVQLDKNSITDGDTVEAVVTINRPDIESEEELKLFASPAKAQYYPSLKEEQWWIVVGRPKLNKLYSIKKITNFKNVSQLQVKLNFLSKKEAHDEGS